MRHTDTIKTYKVGRQTSEGGCGGRKERKCVFCYNHSVGGKAIIDTRIIHYGSIEDTWDGRYTMEGYKTFSVPTNNKPSADRVFPDEEAYKAKARANKYEN